MLIYHKALELFGEPVVETAIMEGSMTFPRSMPNEACYIFMKEGSMISVSAAGSEEVETNDSVLLKCGNYLGQGMADSKTGKQQAVVFHFSADLLRKLYADGLPAFLMEGPELISRKGMAKIKRNELFSRYIESILFYFENPDLVTDEIMVLKIKELLLLLNNTKEAGHIHQILSNLFLPQTMAFKEVIEENLYNDLSINELSVLSNMSISSFKREFKRVYDDSPASYIRNKKLEKAAALLSHSKEQISIVAYDSGFNDLSHFSKLFKKKYQMAPSDYRSAQSISAKDAEKLVPLPKTNA